VPYQQLFLSVKFRSLSPVVDNPGFGLVYQTTNLAATIVDVGDVATKIATSLTAIPTGGTKSPSGYMSNVLDRSANMSSVTVYDLTGKLNGDPHGSPIATKTFTPSAGTAAPMPEGVAFVLTLQAPYGSDVEFSGNTRPRARDRGRIYFGPLNAGAVVFSTDAAGRTIFASQITTDLGKWIQSISNILTTASVPYDLGVWSRANAIVKKAAQVILDDRPDYQRRRADQSTVRTLLPLA
jgi:hypothetical protein